MILRRPYAFFIKMFKPIHLIISVSIAYLIYLSSKILNFLNTYMYSSYSIVGENIKSGLINKLLFIIPAFIIFVSLLILGVMVRKKKPTVFYFVNIFAYIVVIVISFYTSNFLGVLEKSIVSVKAIKLIHDLVLISILIESVSFIFFVVRGMGISLKKFNFDSDIYKFEMSESDKEEFEFDINVDLSEAKRKRKKRLRFLKYKYLENKFFINIIIVTTLVIVLGIFVIVKISNPKNIEGKIYNISGLNIGVDDTITLNTDYKGKKITENYLVIVNCRMQSESNKEIYVNDFNLKIGSSTFEPKQKYSNYLLDIGNVYSESISLLEYGNYLFIYEIPEKFLTSEMIFSYGSGGERLNINLNPKNLVSNKLSISKNIGEELSFEDSLGKILIKISDYDVRDSILFKYNYCVKLDDCILSKEYMKPSLNTNFDKVILRLNMEYNNESDLNINSFYTFLTSFGTIKYKIGDMWYSQSTNFEELKSNKVNTKNNVYIGIKSDIKDAESIKFVFNIRDATYEYLLK